MNYLFGVPELQMWCFVSFPSTMPNRTVREQLDAKNIIKKNLEE